MTVICIKMGNFEYDYDTYFCKIHRCVMFILFVVMCIVTSSIEVSNPNYPSPCLVVMCLV